MTKLMDRCVSEPGDQTASGVHLFRRLCQSAARKLTASRMIAELSGLDVRENCERVQGEAPRCRLQLTASPGVS